MVLFVMPKPLAVGQTYSDPVKFGLQGFVVAGVPTTGKPFELIFWLISSIGVAGLAVGQTYSDPVKFGLQGFVVAGVPTTGKPLKLIFWLISSIGMSKLAVLVRLKTSKLNFREERSVIWVSFTSEMSARLCQDCRKILRWPWSIKFVSYGSLEGTAPFRAPGLNRGRLKQLGLSAGDPATAPEAPV